MNIRPVSVLVILSGIFFTAGDSWAIGPISINAEAGIMSAYVWRGYQLTDGPVFQPSVTLDVFNLYMNVWGNMDLNDVNNHTGEMGEIDYTLEYTLGLVLGELSAGVIHYTTPITSYDKATTEVYLGARGTFPGHPSLTIYRDVDEADGFYCELCASQDIPIEPLTSLELSGSLGWSSSNFNKFYAGLKKGTLSDMSVSIGVPLGIGELFKISPEISFSRIIDGNLRDSLEIRHSDVQNFFYSVTVSVGL